MKNLILVLGIISIFSSCSIEKRIYRPGYHIEWKRNTNSNHNDNTSELQNSNILEESKEHSKTAREIETDLGESNILVAEEVKITKQENPLQKKIDNNCDEIILRSGVIIKGKVTEIGVDEIKYKKCENLEGPTIAILKSEVFLIKYPNGTTDVFEEEEEIKISDFPKNNTYTPKEEIKDEDKMTDSLGIISIILSILGIIFSFLISIGIGAFIGLLGLVLGIISLSRINKNSDKLKGKGLATTGVIIGAIALLIAVTLIVLLLI